MLASTYAFPEDAETASSAAREGHFPSSPERLAFDRDVNPVIRPVIRPAIRDHRKDRLPRYTSYPTAPNFTASVTADDFRGWLAGLAPEANASLYLHVPFFRSFRSTRDASASSTGLGPSCAWWLPLLTPTSTATAPSAARYESPRDVERKLLHDHRQDLHAFRKSSRRT